MQGYTAFKKKKSRLGTTLLIVAAVHLLAGGGLVWLASTAKGRELLAVYKVDILPEILNIGKPAPQKRSASEVKQAPPEAEGPDASAVRVPKQEGGPEAPPAAEAEGPAPETAPEPQGTAELPSDPGPEEADAPAGSEMETAGADLPEESVVGAGAPAFGNDQIAMIGPGSGIGPGGPGPSFQGSGILQEGSSGGIRLPASGNPFASGGGGKGRRFSGYADLITSEIQRHYKQPAELPSNLGMAALFLVRLDEEGRVLEFKLTGSSGSALFDQSALEALSSVKRLRPPPRGMSKTLTVKFFPPTG